MFGVADPDDLQSFKDLVVDFESLTHRVGKHHVKKVFHVTELFFGKNNRKSFGGPISISREGRHLSDQFYRDFLSIFDRKEIIL